MTILPLTYLGSTEWFAHLARGECVVDIGENWVKQTARNRAEILTANGVAALTVPVHGYGAKIAVKDIRIDASKRWQHQHWTSLVSAYKNSPFFDHYEERFATVYTTRKFDFLVDLNLELLEIVTAVMGLGDRVKISEDYVAAGAEDLDLRGKKALRRESDAGIHNPETAVISANRDVTPYIQVFSDRTGFVPGLSVIDLVMCEGPAARRAFASYRHP